MAGFLCATQPGREVRDDFDNETATLEDETCFEWRIQFVHFAQISLGNLRVFGCLPLSFFSESLRVRSRFIECAVTDLLQFGIPVNVDAAAGHAAPAAPAEKKSIAISDVVHHISRNSSPAASYFTCVGEFRPDRCVSCGSITSLASS